jgi:hypothetical protein
MNTLPAHEQRNLERRMYRRAAQQGQMLVKSRRTGERGLYVLVDDTMGSWWTTPWEPGRPSWRPGCGLRVR